VNLTGEQLNVNRDAVQRQPGIGRSNALDTEESEEEQLVVVGSRLYSARNGNQSSIYIPL